MGVQIVFPDFSDALLEGTGAQRESTCACVYGHTQLVVYQGQALKLAHYGPQLHIVAFQELAACRVVSTAKLLEENNLEEIMRRHSARILDITANYTIVEKTGHSDETEALFLELKRYDLTQFVRSGRVAITKSPVELVDAYLKEQEERRQRLTHDLV